MKFTETPLKGAFVIQATHLGDDRGFFERTFCQREFERHGLNPCIRQCNVSWNRLEGTLRGLHYQTHPYSEAKVVKCIRGAIFDVIVDLRPDSATFAKWHAVELSAQKREMLYIPEAFAHGFQTLTDDVEIFYQMSQYYQPEAVTGIRWNDPRLAIAWPREQPILSPRDSVLPFLDEVSGTLS